MTEQRPDLESFDALREAVGAPKMSDDAALAKLESAPDGEDEMEAPLAKDPPRVKAEEVETKAEPAEDVDATPEEEANYEDALRALRRAKTPSAVVQGLSREEVVAWGSQLAKIQRDADGKITELQQLRSKGTETDAPEKPESEPTEATTRADLTAVHTKLSEVLGLDDEGGEVLREGLEALVSPLIGRLDAREQRDSRRDAILMQLVLKETAAELTDRFPQLATREGLKRVERRVQANLASGVHDNMLSALEDAAKAEFYDEQMSSRGKQSEMSATARARGRMSSPSQRPKSAVSMSLDDRLEAVLSGLDNGETDSEISARSGW